MTTLTQRTPSADEPNPLAWNYLRAGAAWVSCPDCGTCKTIDSPKTNLNFFCVPCGAQKQVTLDGFLENI